MTVQKNEFHRRIVEKWESSSASLSDDQKIRLFVKAFGKIEERALKTLSSVTLHVVLDRVISQSAEKFPFLSEVKIEAQGLTFDHLLRNINNHNSENVIEALRSLLIELLSVLGSITADILTSPLHKALMEVTPETSEESQQQDQSLRQIKSGRKSSERA